MRHDGIAAGRADRRRFLALMAAVPGVFALGGLLRAQALPDRAPACRTIYVAGHARHAGIIVDRRDFEPARSIDSPEFLTKDWLEFGWGDADFYQAKGDSILLALRALLFPTSAVMHVYGFNGAPAATFPKSEVVELQLSVDGYGRLLDFLKAAFTRDGTGRVKRLRPGLYGLSFFYAGEGTYHLFHTCNTWAAEALAAGGFPIDPSDIGTVGQLMDRVRGKTRAACAAGSA